MFIKKSSKRKFLFILNTDKFLLSHRIEIANSLIKNNYEVHLGSELSDSSTELKALGIKAHKIYINRTKTGVLDLIRTTFSIYRLINRIKPDVVHFISIKPVLLGCLALKFYKNKIKIITSITGLGYIFVAKGILANLKRFATCLLYKIALSNNQINVIFQNKSDKDFIRNLCNLSTKKIFLIEGSGVDLNKFKPIENKFENNIVILPARIVESKGILEFIKAAEILKGKAKFILCGNYDYEAKDFISESIIKKWVRNSVIEYIGYKKDIEKLFQIASIIVLPSYREGFPKVLCEAAACGIPVITTNVPGCRDAIRNKVTGLLVPPKRVQELSQKILYLLGNQTILKKMSSASRKMAVEKFDINYVVKKHLEIYKI